MQRLRYISFLFVFILSFFIATPIVAAFPDVPSWAKNEVNYLKEQGVVKGLPNGNFGSTDSITRADAALMLQRAKQLPAPSSSKSTFSDVKTSAYYFEAIEAAVEAGFIKGYPNGKFGPLDTLTREQMAKIIADAFELTGTANPAFKDTEKSWAKREIDLIAYEGISEGTTNGSFKPTKNISRAEFSVMLTRALEDSYKLESLEQLNVFSLDVGQSDSTLIQTPEGANILIDAGLREFDDKIVNFLQQQNVEKLDLVIATHPHFDHIGGLPKVFYSFPIDQILDSGRTHTTKTYTRYLEALDDLGLEVSIPEIGETYSFDNDITATILHVDPDAEDINDSSIVTRLVYKDVSFIFPGDAHEKSELEILERGFNLNSTFLKAGHHGSYTSSSQAFLDAVKPEVTLLSYGKDNEHGHPHNSVVKRLKAIGTMMFSTAESGDIAITTNGKGYHIAAEPFNP